MAKNYITTSSKLTAQIANHFRTVYFGGNWTASNLKDNLDGVTWQQATIRILSFNTIATLVYHTSYYISVVLKVLEGETLQASDKFSFNHPPIQSEEDWNNLLSRTWADAERFASLVEKLPEDQLWEDFFENKYGNYYRNLHGIIEHTHYHLGQIVLLKKMILNAVEKSEQ